MRNEWCELLAAVAERGLVDTAGAALAQGRFAVGLVTQDGLQAEVYALMAAGPAADRALDAISPLFASGDVVEIRSLNPAGGEGGRSTYGRLSVPEERARLAEAIRNANGVRNLYFGANARKPDMLACASSASGPDVASRRMLFIDLDDKDAPPTDPDWTRTLAELRALGPAMVLRTGNGWHVYLATDAVDGADVAASAGPIAAALDQLGSDAVADAPRIMRLPNTINLPTSAKRRRGAQPKLAVPEPLVVQPVAARPLSEVCADLQGTAQRLGLPGRGGAVGASAATRVAAGGGEKTGWPAPSADLLRLALSLLPNPPGDAFDDRDEWMRVAHAVKGAAMAGGIETEGRDAFLMWSDQWGGDTDAPGRAWDGIAAPHVGWGQIMRALEQENPAGAAMVKSEAARAAFAQEAAVNRVVIVGGTFDPVASIEASEVPPRRWLYGRTTIAGFLSFLLAPGGAGKSALAMVEAVAMASGKELLDGEKPVRPLRVWMHNAEDDLPEMQRRLAATLRRFSLTHADLNGNLFMTSGRDLKLQLARTVRDGPEIVPGVVDALVERLVAAKLDVLVLDPLGALREIAHRADAAVVILHHAGKAAAIDMDMDSAGAGASRGASAFTDAARVVRQVVRMTTKEAGTHGIAEADRRDYLRVENGKANLARADDGRLFRMADVALNNGMGLWPLGDRVGVVERWTPPTAQPGTANDLARVQAALGASPMPARADHRSPDWIGWLVANALALDAGGSATAAKDRTPAQAGAFARVRALVNGWLRDGGLIVAEVRDPTSRKSLRAVHIGTPAIMIDPDASSDTDDPEAND
jgi:hypothetical protein